MIEWISLSEKVPPQHCGLILVTNNLTARDAFGKMSHLWLTMMVHQQRGEDRKRYGKFVCYADGERLIHALTHWRPAVPEEWEEAAHFQDLRLAQQSASDTLEEK